MSQCFCKCSGAHDRFPGLLLLVLLTTIGSAVAITMYLMADKKPRIYQPEPKPTTTRSVVTGVRG